MSEFLILLLSGLVAGAIYSIYASGLTLLYATTGIYNLAFGAFAFVGGLTFYEFSSAYLSRWVACVVVIFVLAPASGLVLEKIIFRRLARVPEVARLMGTIGLVVALPALAYETVTLLTTHTSLKLASVETLDSVPGLGPEPPKIFHILGTGTISSDQLIVLGATLIAVGGLWALMTRTRIGLSTRAVVDRAELATARGINPAFTSRFAWSLGTSLAALAGILSGPLFGLSTTSALQFVVASSACVVLARFTSLPIAVGAGLGLGAASSLIAGYGDKVPAIARTFEAIPGTQNSFIYLALLGALLWRGRQSHRIAGVTRIAEPVPPDYLADLPVWRRAYPWVGLAAGILIWGTGALPWSRIQAGGLETTIIIQGLGLCLVFLSFTVVVGMLGVASLAQAAFVTVGALVSGAIASHGFLGGDFVIAVIGGGLVAALLACIVALPAMRLGGVALALATLALGYLCDQILFQINWLNNYGLGWQLRRPTLGSLNFNDDGTYIVLLVAIVALALWLVTNFQKSRTGRAIVAVRFGAAAAAASGISTRKAIVTAFGMAGFLAGIGGSLMAYGARSASPTAWPTAVGLLWISIAVVQGVRRPSAALLGGLFAVITDRVLQTGFWGILPNITDATVPAILFGLSCVLLANQPDGILHNTSKQNWARRQKRARRRAERADESSGTVEVVLGASKDNGSEPDSPVRPLAPPALRTMDAAPAPVDHSGVPPGTAALELKGVRAGYVDVEVLHGIDLVVPLASIVAILGPNGAGKSTLCSTIAGLVPVTHGSITFDGISIENLAAHKRYVSGILLAPESRGIFPGLTVEENLEVVLRSRDARNRALERFPQLSERRQQVAANLSGGEQQMLCLAPILIEPPRLLIADEITLGLAPTIAREIRNCLRELSEEGVTIILVEEQAHSVLDMADYCAFLELGRVTQFGPASEVTESMLAERYLGAVVAPQGA